MELSKSDQLARDGAKGIVELIKEFKLENPSIVGKNLKKFINEFTNILTVEINASLQGFVDSLESESFQEELAFDEAGYIFEIMEALTLDADISAAQLTEVMMNSGVSSSKELVEAFIESHNEKSTFVQSLVQKLKSEKKVNRSELDVIREYKQSSGARKDVMRLLKKESLSLNGDIIQKFLDEYGSATRAEVLVRLEKYVESGWFEADAPLKNFYNEKSNQSGDVKAAVISLKVNMENRFSTAKFDGVVIQEGNAAFKQYNLDIQKGTSGSVFNLARGGEKDFCIESTDGKTIYIGDVTAEETGKQNHASWLNGLKAAKKLEKTLNKNIDYSVNIVSLFYDKKEDSELKAKFLKKLDGVNQSFIDKFHFLQFLSVLNRDSIDFENDTVELLNLAKVSFIGSSSETYCNNMLQFKGNQFVENSLNIAEDILTKLVKNRIKNKEGNLVYFDGEHETATVEVVPIGILLNALSGLSSLVTRDKDLMKKYSSLKGLVRELKNATVHGGELDILFDNTVFKMAGIDMVKENQDEDRERYNKFKKEVDVKQKNLELIQQEREHILNTNKDSIANLLKEVKLFLTALGDLTKETDHAKTTRSKQIDEVLILDITNAIDDLLLNPRVQKKLIRIAPTVMKDAMCESPSTRKVLYQLAQALNASYNNNSVSLAKNLDLTIKEMSGLLSNTNFLIDNIVKSDMKVSMLKNKITALGDKSNDDIREFLSVRINDVKEFMAPLIENINKQEKKILKEVSSKINKKHGF